MNTNHTPGPWVFHEQGDANQFCLLTSDKNWVISFGQNGELSTEKQIANAKLIAAAPELLNALIDVLNVYGPRANNGTIGHVVITKAERAIKKATE